MEHLERAAKSGSRFKKARDIKTLERFCGSGMPDSGGKQTLQADASLRWRLRHEGSLKKVGLDLTGMVKNGADDDKIRRLPIEDDMRLEPEASKARPKIVHDSTDFWKVSEEVERAIQPGQVGPE